MSRSATTALSTVDFPASESRSSPPSSSQQLRPPYLPFRRISLPTAPSQAHRHSVVSVASFDSLPEDAAPVQPVASPSSPKRVVKIKPTRPTSVDMKRHQLKRKTVDDAKEAKRRKIILEFYETERAYVDGLELIYSQFLAPIIASLDTPSPLLDRASLTSVFSNFIDIWNLHRSFYSSLRTLLSAHHLPPPPLSPILLSHFPYLSLYTPFITSFPDALSSLVNLTSASSPAYNQPFALFLKRQQDDPKCGKLSLRDWLLTIVQRCPRYLLLLKDLIGCTSEEDPEHAQLTAVHTLVSKITLSLNTSLHTHAQTLALLALQRSTPNLPFQLIAPGRTLLKRGSLILIERSSQPREREFLLFSDCLLWLAPEESESVWKSDWWNSSQTGLPNTSSANPSVSSSPSKQCLSPVSASPKPRPGMIRTRSKSDAELPSLKISLDGSGEDDGQDPARTEKTRSVILNPTHAQTPIDPTTALSPPVPPPLPSRRSQPPPPKPSGNLKAFKRHASAGGGEEKWTFKGKVDIVDMEVVVNPSVGAYGAEEGGERRFEILSPEGSFVLYSGSEEERDDWVSSMRQAKLQLLISINITNPHSTLTSSSSTNHIRRSLQALPFLPSDDRLTRSPEGKSGTRASVSTSALSTKLFSPSLDGAKNGKKASQRPRERRGKVEHWVPAIWIPDGKAEGCMRCGRSFGWRRRRHHCRLCGRCVCASCSGRVFFISDPNAKSTSAKPARACDACYETVFPLMETDTEPMPAAIPWSASFPPNMANVSNTGLSTSPSSASSSNWLSREGHIDSQQPGMEESPSYASNTVHFLANFPAWLSMPSLPLANGPQALMALDRGMDRDRPPPSPRKEAGLVHVEEAPEGELENEESSPTSPTSSTSALPPERHRVRMKPPPSRPRSYIQLLEDFEDMGASRFDITVPVAEESDNEERDAIPARNASSSGGESTVREGSLYSARTNTNSSASSASSRRQTMLLGSAPTSPAKREDTAKRNKRFSMPAVALQTTTVEARTRQSVYIPSSSSHGHAFGATEGGSGHAQGYSQAQGGYSALGPRQKRFSLVLGAPGGAVPNHRPRAELGSTASQPSHLHGHAQLPTSRAEDHPATHASNPRLGAEGRKGGPPSAYWDKATLGRGEAAEKLTELLSRANSNSRRVSS